MAIRSSRDRNDEETGLSRGITLLKSKVRSYQKHLGRDSNRTTTRSGISTGNSNMSSHRPSTSTSPLSPTVDAPVIANFDSAHLTIGAGVAIFHLASARVVLCFHSHEKYWFLPKGRKDVNEPLTAAAEREGYEESGYRNRLLPIPLAHRQPTPKAPYTSSPSSSNNAKTSKTPAGYTWATEPVWMQLVPVSRTAQYILSWYVAETLPADVEPGYPSPEGGGDYTPPPPFPSDMTLRQRIALDNGRHDNKLTNQRVYEPIRHDGTGVDADEALYESSLVPIAEAVMRLGEGSVSADVVRRGWDAVLRRIQMEDSIICSGAGAADGTEAEPRA